MNRTSRLTAAIASALMLTASHAAPALAATISVVDFTRDVVMRLEHNDVDGARWLLVRLREFGIESIEVGGKIFDVDSLVDRLRGSHVHAGAVAVSLSGVATRFIPCNGPWRSKVNLSAPPPFDIFPTGSAGVC